MRPGEGTASVIIPAYNAEATLSRAIESVLGQSMPAREIIVVDDGSTDQTASIPSAFGSRVTLVRQSRAGPAKARNTGARAASGQALAFLDADDVWHQDKLRLQLDALSRYRDLAFCACLFHSPPAHSDPFVPKERVSPPFVRVLSDFRAVFRNPYFGTPCVVMPTSVFHECGGFDETLTVGEDVDLWLRAAYRREVAIVEAVLVTVYRTPNSLSRSRHLDTYKANLRVIEHFCTEHPEFATSHRELVREVRSAVMTELASERMLLGDHRNALDLLWRAIRLRPSYRASYLLVKAAVGTMVSPAVAQ